MDKLELPMGQAGRIFSRVGKTQGSQHGSGQCQIGNSELKACE